MYSLGSELGFGLGSAHGTPLEPRLEWLELELVTVLVLGKLFVFGLDLSSLYSLSWRLDLDLVWYLVRDLNQS